MREFYTLALLILTALATSAQNLDLEELTKLKQKKPIKLSGSISASVTYMDRDPHLEQKPFLYQFNGTLNLTAYESLHLPLSFSLNNYGSHFSYPSLPSRLSLHPSYRWAQAHIGDVSMNFSPYTLNGHQFTGVGVELTPKKWKMALMAGRLLRKTTYDISRPHLLPTFDRWGYGIKLRYDGEKYFIGGTLFSASDRANQVTLDTERLGIHPKKNVALSTELGLRLIDGMEFTLEYAISLLTQDIRAPRLANSSFIDKLLGRQSSTATHHALKTSFSYTFLRNTIGLGYERISPSYETLGAYYFTNDYENLTLNYAHPFFSDRLQLALSAGIQRDGLTRSNPQLSRRVVSSLNLTFTPNDRLNATLSTSTFQNYRNLKSNFDYINAQGPYDGLDTLDFTQINNNIDLYIAWTAHRTEQRTDLLSFTTSYQATSDHRGGELLQNQLSRFINTQLTYSLDFLPLNLSTTLGLSFSNSYLLQRGTYTYGPNLSTSWRTFKKALRLSLSVSMSHTTEESHTLADIYNTRFAASYTFLKRHSLNASCGLQHRLSRATEFRSQATTTAGLSYVFSF